MKKQAWNWLHVVVVTTVAGLLAHTGYLLLQGRNIDRGEWGWLFVGLACLAVIQLTELWDDSRRGRNAAGAPGLATGQVPKEASTD